MHLMDQTKLKSADLPEFKKWVDFADLPDDVPKSPGYYIFRLKGEETFKRISGETDIIYIGSSKNLRNRMNSYLHPGKTTYTNIKINRFVKHHKHEVEVAWVEESEADNARSYEGSLLNRFEAAHHELPPLNGASVRAMKFKLEDTIHS